MKNEEPERLKEQLEKLKVECRAWKDLAQANLDAHQLMLERNAAEAEVLRAKKALADLTADDNAWKATYERTHAKLLKVTHERDGVAAEVARLQASLSEALALLQTTAERVREAAAQAAARALDTGEPWGGLATVAYEAVRAVDLTVILTSGEIRAEARRRALARLIAAAPDLLAALRDLCRYADPNPSVLHARAIIAKATGGKP